MEFKTLTELSMYFAKYLFPDEKCPVEFRSNVPIEEMRDINYKCFQILIGIAFRMGWMYVEQNPLASDQQIMCASIDYVIEKHNDDKEEKKKFFRHCFRCGAYCKKDNKDIVLL